MPDFAHDRKSIRLREKAARLRDRQDDEVTTAIMSTIAGREWLWTRLAEAHIFDDPFTGDALREAFSKGERNFGLRLLACIMRACPDSYILAMREANARASTDERRRSEEPDGRDLGSNGPDPDSGSNGYLHDQDGDEDRDHRDA